MISTKSANRFIDKILVTDTCWLWESEISRKGYGKFWESGCVDAHRFSYELFVGQIPEGMVLDHVKARGCANRHCVNPSHLEPVSHAENIARGDAGLPQLSRTHCPKGHEYSGQNLYIGTNRRGSNRQCRACKRDWYIRNKAGNAMTKPSI